VGRRQHFVPLFYLEAFSSAPRRINILNLERCQLITEASLRDQCYAHHLYGADDTIENALAEVEGAAANVFRALREQRVVPAGGTTERQTLLFFIGLQLARTTAAQAHAVERTRLMADVAFGGSPPPGFDLSPQDAIKLTLNSAPAMAATISDLAVTLVLACSGSSFATSDNPAFLYNSYCEGITYAGVTGTECRGLQLFLPVSPQLLLFLFDAGVYKLRRSTPRFVNATERDMESLNRLQLVAAHENAYSATPDLGSWLLASASGIQALRKANRSRIVEAVAVDDDRSALLHGYTPMPQLQLQLSFVSIRGSAVEIPLCRRIHQVRGPYKARDRIADAPGPVRRFVAKSRHDP
jgi:Protein of unknown function (DUF4238)